MTSDFFALATPGVQGLKPYLPGKPLSELEREYGIRNAIKLASNENPLGPSPQAIEAIKSALTDLARYPDGSGHALKQALAQHLGISPAAITLGNGSNDVLELAARAFADHRHSIVYSQYAFAVYPIVTQAVGAEAIVTPAKEWGHDLSAMQAAIRENTRLIFIANPNNPTGTWVDRRSLRAFLSALSRSVIVVIDEAYFEYVDHPDYPNSLDWLDQFPNIIVTRTFSKAYGLAGLRVGFAVSHPEVANLLNRVRQPFNVNSLALAAAQAALNSKEHLAASVALNHAGMAQLSQAFEKMGLSYIPSVGNFITVDLKRSGAELYELLLREGVIVRPIANYGMPTHLRISIGLEAENARFIKALQKVLAAH